MSPEDIEAEHQRLRDVKVARLVARLRLDRMELAKLFGADVPAGALADALALMPTRWWSGLARRAGAHRPGPLTIEQTIARVRAGALDALEQSQQTEERDPF